MVAAIAQSGLAASKIRDVQRAIEHTARVPEAFRVDHPQPHWIGGGDAFWLKEVHRDGSHRFALVDCVRRVRIPAFDHQFLAKSIAAKRGALPDPRKLPLDNLKFSDDLTLTSFEMDGQIWSKGEDGWSHEPLPEPSRPHLVSLSERSSSGGSEMDLKFVNRTDVPLRIEWVDGFGKKRPYAQIPPRSEHHQRTFSGHVWHAVSRSGEVVASFRACEKQPVILIESTHPIAPSPPDQPRPFIRDHNVFWQSASSEKSIQLTSDGTAENSYVGPLVFSADRNQILCVQRKPEQKHTVSFIEAAPKGQLEPKLHQNQYLKPGDQIAELSPVLIDIRERTVIRLDKSAFVDAWSIDHLRWNAELDPFTPLHNRRGHQEQRVVSIRCDGSVKTLVHETSPTFIDYSQKTQLEWLGDGTFLWASERSGWNHLYRFDGRTGSLLNAVTEGAWAFRRIHLIDLPTRTAWLTVSGVYPDQDPFHIHLIRTNLDRTEVTRITAADGTHCKSNHPAPDDRSLVLSPNHRWLVARWSRIDHPPVTEVRDAFTGEFLLSLSDGFPLEIPEGDAWPLPERFSALGRDGSTPIHGIIIRPSHFDPSMKYPVIEEIYAGPHGHFVPKTWTALPRQHTVAEMGAIVVQIDGMGTNWRSRAFHDVAWRNIKDAGFPDRIAWMKAAAVGRPWMDLSRVGVYGGSAGGQNALAALLHHGHFYKTAVADCGCHDNRMDKIWWNEAWMGLLGPWYAENSNVSHAHRLEGHLLLIVGEVDTNVDPASTMQVANALVRADNAFELLVMPPTGHGAAETPYASRKRLEFLHKHLISGNAQP